MAASLVRPGADESPRDDNHREELARLMADGSEEGPSEAPAVGEDRLEEDSESYVDPKFSPTTTKSAWSKMMDWVGWAE